MLQMYNVTNLFEDIKQLYKIAGFKGQPVCFLFTDAEVKDEAFLEYINQILMTGEVAGMGSLRYCKEQLLLVQLCTGVLSAAAVASHLWYLRLILGNRDNLVSCSVLSVHCCTAYSLHCLSTTLCIFLGDVELSMNLVRHGVYPPAGLFPKDELDMIINDMRPIMKLAAPGVTDTWDNLYAFFLNRVRDNLHVMLCFSPVGNKFSRRAMQFPGLINGCTIDWFLPWPEEALTSGAYCWLCGSGSRACLELAAQC